MARGTPGISRLLSHMRKLIQEVNDQEICRRLEILMNTEKDDLPSSMLRTLLDAPGEFDPRQVPEPYTQYVKHYLYMVKRQRRDAERSMEEEQEDSSANTPAPVTPARKVATKAQSKVTKKTVKKTAKKVAKKVAKKKVARK